MSLGELPVDILVHIASLDIPTYRAMLTIPTFARALLKDKNQGDQLGKKIRSGFLVKHASEESTYWTLNGLRHREEVDGETPPAVINNEVKQWCKFGRRHRDETDAAGEKLPAEVWANGTRKWFIHNDLHREDGPAKILVTGEKFWYLWGSLHREDIDGKSLPAEEFSNGINCWWKHGSRRHVECPEINEKNSSEYWAINIRIGIDDGCHLAQDGYFN